MRPLRRRVDAVTVLTWYLVLLFAIPSRLGFAPLGGAGAPAVVLGGMCFAWWLYSQVQRTRATHAGSQPVRTAYFVMMTAFLISYVVAMTRAIESSESSTANLGMVTLFSYGGILLVANDGISSSARLYTLVRRLVLAGALEASLGIFQFVSGQTWVDRVSIPGLSANQALGGVSSRSGFNRPPGTAIHAIEFGIVLTMILPIAINLALSDTRRTALRRWAPVLLILLASVLSISRSAIVGLVVGLIVVAIRWPSAVRWRALALAPVFTVAVFVVFPGLLGTLTGLFTGIGTDTSAASRTGSYAIAEEFIKRSPVFGRGYSTFLPTYRILDNQYLLSLIEVGIVGVLALLGLLLTGMACLSVTRRHSKDFAEQQMSHALIGSLSVAGVGLALFDGFSFPQMPGTLFLVLGLAGATYKIARLRPIAEDVESERWTLETGQREADVSAGTRVRRPRG
jgi:O-antigen ligase